MKTLKENLLKNVGVGKVKLIGNWLAENTRIVGKYTITKDFSIDVFGNVEITNHDLKEFPEYIQFGDVKGYFKCSICPLKSLRGCPNTTGFFFDCWDCDLLESLEGGPKKVGGYFSCRNCYALVNLKGAPEIVDGSFICSGCSNLISLEGSPQKVQVIFDCSDCSKLNSLKGAPKEVGDSFICTGCKRQFKMDEVREVSRVKKGIRV